MSDPLTAPPSSSVVPPQPQACSGHATRLVIEAFRGLGPLDLELKPVTLLTGGVSAGKTSVLEALGLAMRPTSPGQWASTAFRRDAQAGLCDGIWSMFPDGKPIQLDLEINGARQHTHIEILRERADRLSLSVDVDGQRAYIDFPGGLGGGSLAATTRPLALRMARVAHTLGAYTYAKAYFDGMTWLARQPAHYKTLVLRLLASVDATITDLRLDFQHENPLILLLRGGRWVNLATIGDGPRRVLALALALVRAVGGVLLVDGLEQGLHHGVIEPFVTALLWLARDLDIQLVMSVSSLEAIDAALAESERRADSAARGPILHWLAAWPPSTNNHRAYPFDKLQRLREGGMDVR